jgi:hypothetical protein
MRSVTGLLAAIALCAGFAVPAHAAGLPPTVRLVLDDGTSNGVQLAAWTPDDRYIVTVNGLNRAVVIWDTRSGEAIDRLQLPLSPGTSNLRLDDIKLDERQALLRANVLVQDSSAARGLTVTRVFKLDLGSRTISFEDSPKRSPQQTRDDLAATATAQAALSAFYDQSARAAELEHIPWDQRIYTPDKPNCEPRKITTALPALPASHDGGRRLIRQFDGLSIVDADGRCMRLTEIPIGEDLIAAAVSPDGRKLAQIILGQDGRLGTRVIDTFDFDNPIYNKQMHTDDVYTKNNLSDPEIDLAWIDSNHYLMSPRQVFAPSADGSRPEAAPALIVDTRTIVSDRPQSAGTMGHMDARCHQTPLSATTFIGAGLGSCGEEGSGTDHQLQRYDGTGWTPFAAAAVRGRWVDAISVSPDGQAVAVALHDKGGAAAVVALDASTGALVDAVDLEKFPGRATLAYTLDGKAVVIAAGGDILVWRPGLHVAALRVATGMTSPPVLLADGRTIFVSRESGAIRRLDMAGGPALPDLEMSGTIAAGFLRDGRIFWAASRSGSIRFWAARDSWPLLMSRDWIRAKPHTPPAMRLPISLGISMPEPLTLLTTKPDGRYDTGFGPEVNGFHWLASDDPFRPLPPFLFMRDYYEPHLASRLMTCASSDQIDACANAFGPLRPIGSLDRALPRVRIVGMRQVSRDTMVVDVEARDVVDPGGTHSGVYDLRLYWGYMLVGEWPHPRAPAHPADIHEWRADNRWAPDADGVFRHSFSVAWPRPQTSPIGSFRAYAFNGDRLRSETVYPDMAETDTSAGNSREIGQKVAQELKREEVKNARKTMALQKSGGLRPPRTYLLTIGVNRYQEPIPSLKLAATDARQMAALLPPRLINGLSPEATKIQTAEFANRLARGAGVGDARTLQLLSEDETNQSPAVDQALKANIRDALSLLAHPDEEGSKRAAGDRQAALKRLRDAGIDKEALRGWDVAGPFDTLIIIFSGHGWSSAQGEFYLVPADGALDEAAAKPKLDSLISSDELAFWLRNVDPGVTAIILDACYSAASVEANGFKPGPMGDRGLGQLAYDKGIRILVAANGEAQENDKLGQGLLTYALIQGLSRGAYSDDPDPKPVYGPNTVVAMRALPATRALPNGLLAVTLADWLAGAAKRLSSLTAETERIGDGRPGAAGRGENRPAPQVATLFNFNTPDFRGGGSLGPYGDIFWDAYVLVLGRADAPTSP